MTLALILACRLLLIEPPADERELPEDYSAAIERIESLNKAVNRDPEANYEALAESLDQLARFAPTLSADPHGREVRLLALLNLARALLLTGHDAGAGLMMDEAIRLVRGGELPVARFGPTLSSFHTDRREALAKRGSGQLHVECRQPCRVYLDELELTLDESGESGPLLLGSYRVWIEGSEPEAAAPERHLVELDVDGEIETLAFPIAPVEVADEAPPPPAPRRRLLPRWAEIGGLALGVGLIATGGVLLGVDGRCPKGRDPVDDAALCPKLYESSAGGFTALGLGAALGLSGGVLLTIDEVRVGKARAAQAMLGYTIRF
ncbi:hypothetical protein ACNOYE_27975 [Nannocystaceae bacterium ST9]